MNVTAGPENYKYPKHLSLLLVNKILAGWEMKVSRILVWMRSTIYFLSVQYLLGMKINRREGLWSHYLSIYSILMEVEASPILLNSLILLAQFSSPKTVWGLEDVARWHELYILCIVGWRFEQFVIERYKKSLVKRLSWDPSNLLFILVLWLFWPNNILKITLN